MAYNIQSMAFCVFAVNSNNDVTALLVQHVAGQYNLFVKCMFFSLPIDVKFHRIPETGKALLMVQDEVVFTQVDGVTRFNPTEETDFRLLPGTFFNREKLRLVPLDQSQADSQMQWLMALYSTVLHPVSLAVPLNSKAAKNDVSNNPNNVSKQPNL